MKRKITHTQQIAVALLLAAALTACDSDSPTAPSVTPTSTPTPTPSAAWTVTVSANPSSIGLEELVELGGVTAKITVNARRSDSGQVPPQGATAVLSATAGTLVAGSSTGTEIPVAFDSSGRAVADLILPAQAVSIVVRAQLEQNAGQTTVRVLEAPEEAPLFIESIVPSSGPPSGGTQVRIQGSGFDPPVRVSFGGVFADVLSVQPNAVTVLTPPVDLPVGGTSTVPVTVSINVNDPEDPPGSDTLANAYTYARAGETQAPSIISISPTSGPNEGGTQVTIFGENFAQAVQVFFGTSALIEAPVISVAPTRIVVETPSATGPNSINQNAVVSIRVVNVGSGAFADLGGAYQYGAPGGGIFISSAGPTEGYYFGGLNVTIFGQGFDEPVAVEFGGLAQQRISVTGTEIIARSVPAEIMNCNRPTGPFSVVNIETNEVASSDINFIYRPVEPVIATIDPLEIPIVAATRDILPSGATATLTGTGFDFAGESLPIPPRVTFGDATAPLVAGTEVLDPSFDPRYGIVGQFVVVIPRYLDSFEDIDCNDPFGNEGTRPRPARVSVTVLNVPTGCTDSVSFDYIPVQADGSALPCVVGGSPPVAGFSVSTENLTATFTDTSTNEPTTWLWDFGDGATDTLQNPVHAYAAAGTYTVTLTASNAFGTSAPFSAMVTVVDSPPVAAFDFQGVAGSDTITFLDQSTGNPTTWLWEFGDGGTSTAQNPTHDYNVVTPTVFTVTLTVSNASGSDSASKLVTVPVPGGGTPVEAAFSFVVSGPLEVTFTDQSTGDPTSWAWDFGDGSISAQNSVQNPVHTYVAAGNYTVELEVMNAGGSTDSLSLVVLVPVP